MSAANKLRLGPLPKTESVRLTITLSAALMATLNRYAELHAQIHSGKADVAALVPHMLHAFMDKDRGFKKAGARASATGFTKLP